MDIWRSAKSGKDSLTDVVTDRPVIVCIWQPPARSDRRSLVIESPNGDILMEIPLTKAARAGLLQALS